MMVNLLFRLMATALLLLTLESRAIATPDPAVAHANAVKGGSISYHEDYFGEGDDRLHYVEAGEGPLILFYHGFPSFWFSWFDQMEMLKTRYRVVAVDALGAGRSAKPSSTDAYRIDRLAAQVDALARHLAGEDRFILVGHDWGAALAFAYAQAYPTRLHGVVGMSAPPYNLFLDLVRNNPEQQARSGYMQQFRRLDLSAIAKLGLPERIWRQSYEGLLTNGSLSDAEAQLFKMALADPQAIDGGMNWYRANIPAFASINKEHRWPASERKITVPALMIWGEEDQTFVDDVLNMMPQYAFDLAIVRVPEVGHWTPMEKPKKTNEAIERFVAAVNPQG